MANKRDYEQVVSYSLILFLFQYMMQIDIREIAELCGGSKQFYLAMYASGHFNFKKLSNIAISMFALKQSSTMISMFESEFKVVGDLQPFFSLGLFVNYSQRIDFVKMISLTETTTGQILNYAYDPYERFSEVTDYPLNQEFFKTHIYSAEFDCFKLDCTR